jgi:hypothetical protein
MKVWLLSSAFMIDPKNIDVEKSLSSGWLKGSIPAIDNATWIVTLLVTAAFASMGFYFIWTAIKIKMQGLTIGASLLTVFFSYLVYRTFILHKLQKIETMMLAKDIRLKLFEYFAAQRYVIEFDSTGVMMIYDPGPEALLRNKPTKYIIILYKNCNLQFCTMTEGKGVDLFQLFGAWGLKKDLTSLLN